MGLVLPAVRGFYPAPHPQQHLWWPSPFSWHRLAGSPRLGVMTGLPGSPQCHSLASSSCERLPSCVHSTWTGLCACVFRGGWQKSVLGRRVKPHLAWLFSAGCLLAPAQECPSPSKEGLVQGGLGARFRPRVQERETETEQQTDRQTHTHVNSIVPSNMLE